ncbi:alpha/beta fold hydrolase [Nocardiopsis sp. L17-MgMaSL7]|uniref:alpha/beta fold hydrolase n=1 Tax=Nocardiopsis sp. L17-MgMaSL7 TaxID=1938893 RepID=UPI000D7134F7|nr:alpha/beta fold hydrolase [Nocardiopsis sp. L17-MgMaSL7]PWV55353.1 pimeloyl-ACP methyl ester carboxylesterase [Nocardiopsis sp. L17-MgMaSL7]
MTAHLVGDVTTRYADIPPLAPGDPVPVLLLHGFGVDFDINWRQAGWPDALAAAGRRVIGPDLRGHGASDKPTDSGLYLPEHFVADLLALLDDLGLDCVDVIAYSMGARIAWELARTAPERVRRLVLGGFGPRTLDLAGLGAVHPDGDSAFDDMYRTVAAIPGNDPAALVACARGQASRPFQEEPRPEGLPLLLVHGTADHLAEGAAGLAERSGVTHVEIPDRDHVDAVFSPLFIKTVVDFLAD